MENGSNALTIADTELGLLYRLAQERGMRTPRNAGEIAIAAWLSDHVKAIGGPALVVYENGPPAMLSREGVETPVAVATTRNFLTLAQEHGIIVDAAPVWLRIVAAMPTANPADVVTFIRPDAS